MFKMLLATPRCCGNGPVLYYTAQSVTIDPVSRPATQQVSQCNTLNCLSCGTPLPRSVTAPRPPNFGPQQRHL